MLSRKDGMERVLLHISTLTEEKTWQMANIWLFVRFFLLLFILGRIAVIDYQTKKIPNRYIGYLAIIVIFFPEEYGMGAIFIGIPMMLAGLLKPGALGGGDIKLMIIMGWYLGSHLIFIAALCSLLSAFFYFFCKYKTINAYQKPFALGPFLCAGLAAALVISLFLGQLS